MKSRTLPLMAMGGLLLAGDTAPGGFIGLQVELKPNEFGLVVLNVYATFNNPNDVMIAVAGTPATPLNVEVVGGTFYQHRFGDDKAPNPALIGLFPSLAYDTFVTIGKKTSTDDQTALTPGWPGFGASQLPTDPSDAGNMGWFITPDQPQGVPDVDGRVLVGQFSSADIGLLDDRIEGTFLIQGIADGELFEIPSSFVSPHGDPAAPGALPLLLLAGLARGRRRRRAPWRRT